MRLSPPMEPLAWLGGGWTLQSNAPQQTWIPLSHWMHILSNYQAVDHEGLIDHNYPTEGSIARDFQPVCAGADNFYKRRDIRLDQPWIGRTSRIPADRAQFFHGESYEVWFGQILCIEHNDSHVEVSTAQHNSHAFAFLCLSYRRRWPRSSESLISASSFLFTVINGIWPEMR